MNAYRQCSSSSSLTRFLLSLVTTIGLFAFIISMVLFALFLGTIHPLLLVVFLMTPSTVLLVTTLYHYLDNEE